MYFYRKITYSNVTFCHPIVSYRQIPVIINSDIILCISRLWIVFCSNSHLRLIEGHFKYFVETPVFVTLTCKSQAKHHPSNQLG